jgi:hypothetical protein
MIKTIHVKADVPSSREVKVILPPEVPTGPADLVVFIATDATHTGATLGDLLRSEFFGAWSDRKEIEDSAEFARSLREKAWKRP